MTTFIKTKFKISDLEFPSKFQVKEKNIQMGPETTKFDFCDPDSHLGKVQYRIWNPNQNSKSKEKKLFKSVQKQRNRTVVVRTVIWGKYNIEFLIPIKFPSQRKKIY